jgi:hypothetical protein
MSTHAHIPHVNMQCNDITLSKLKKIQHASHKDFLEELTIKTGRMQRHLFIYKIQFIGDLYIKLIAMSHTHIYKYLLPKIIME